MALIALATLTSACLPLRDDDPTSPCIGIGCSPSTPPECTTDTDCAAEDTDDDPCTVALCRFQECEVIEERNTDACQCWDDADCDAPRCGAATCADHQCVVDAVPAGPAADQEPGDCAVITCDGTSTEGSEVADPADLPAQVAGNCTTYVCDPVAAEPSSVDEPSDVPANTECTVGVCDTFGPEDIPLADGTACGGGAGFCFLGECVVDCQPANPAACGSDGAGEPANDQGSAPLAGKGGQGTCGFLDASDVDWYTFHAVDGDFSYDVLWLHAWSTAATLELCAYVQCGDGTFPGGGCAEKLDGPEGSKGCCWSGSGGTLEAGWDLDCGTNEDSGNVWVSVRAIGGDTCETYQVAMSY